MKRCLASASIVILLVSIIGVRSADAPSGPAEAEVNPPVDTGGGDPEGDGVLATPGDWTVEAADDLLYQHTAIILNGNLTVEGQLVLYNVTIVVNTTHNGSNWIRVANGGKLSLLDVDDNLDTSDDNTVVTASVLDRDHQFEFYVEAGGELQMHNSELRGCGHTDAGDEETGLFIEGEGCDIVQSRITNCTAGVTFNDTTRGYVISSVIEYNEVGIRALDSSVFVEGSELVDQVYVGVWAQGPNAKVTLDNSSSTSEREESVADLMATGGGTIHSINSTYKLVNSTDGTIIVSNYLRIHIYETETLMDLQGVDVRIGTDGQWIYNSTGWGGDDKRTDARGMTGWVLADHGWYRDSDVMTRNITNMEAWVDPVETMWWAYLYDINMSVSHTSSTSIDQTPPAPPSDLAVNAAGETWVDMQWTASPSTYDVSRYAIWINDTGSQEPDVRHRNIGNSTAYNLTFLAPRTQYWFSIAAADITGNESPGRTNVVTATTIDATAPAAPAAVFADDITGGSMTLHWSWVTEDDVGGYRVYMSGPNSTEDYELHGEVGDDANEMEITGLESESVYHFRVCAVDDFDPPNISEYTEANATTLDVSPPLAPVMFHPSSPTNSKSALLQGFVFKGYDENDKGIPDAGASVIVYNNNATAGMADVVAETGLFSLPLTLEEGMNYIEAVALDGADPPNYGPRSAGLIVIQDTQAPVADAGPDVESFVGEEVEFDPGSSRDNLRIKTYSWRFMEHGDPVVLEPGPGTTKAVHRFMTASTYDVTLTVTDGAGNTAEDGMRVRVRPPDTEPPEVLSHVPGRDAADVNITGRIRVEFSEPVNRSTLDINVSSYGGPVAGKPAFMENNTVLWTSNGLLAYSTWYLVVLSVEDLHGNLLPDYDWEFYTEDHEEPDTTPELTDTDGDRLPDEWEEKYGLDPRDPDDAGGDLDRDGLTNLEEFLGPDGTAYTGDETDPEREDSDGDGYTDKEEMDAGTDPNNEFDKPLEAGGGGGGEGGGGSSAWAVAIAGVVAAIIVVVILILMMMKKKRKAGEPGGEEGQGKQGTSEGVAPKISGLSKGKEEGGNCEKCGAALTPDSEFCPKCGETVPGGKGKVSLVIQPKVAGKGEDRALEEKALKLLPPGKPRPPDENV